MMILLMKIVMEFYIEKERRAIQVEEEEIDNIMI